MRILTRLSLALLLAACSSPEKRANETASCAPPPFGETTLFLRGSMSSWAALTEYAFQYRCDGYYLNVDERATHDFKIADAGWANATTFGSKTGTDGMLTAQSAFPTVSGADPGGTANLRFAFKGEHTVRVSIDAGIASVTIGPRSFVDAQAPVVTDPVALSVRFDSRALVHKAPFGAQVPGTPIEFVLTALPGVESAMLVIESRRLEGNQEVLEYREIERVPMTEDQAHWRAQHRFAAIGVYGYWFELVIGGQAYVFQNNRDGVFWTREKGSGGSGVIAFKPTDLERIRRYRQTIYAADFQVPEWAPDVVYYYIFPERFRNGDPANDPKPGVARFHDGTVEVHRDWNEKPFVSGTGDGSDARYSNDFFGGDLKGITDKLDYIRELGANTLYITPLFRAASNHKYDTADYRNIDPGFGSNADFLALTAEATRRGMRVIADTSLNHTGIDSPYFDRYGNHPGIGAFENGEIRADSPYASWYTFDPANAENPYRGWSGARDLPELDKTSEAFRQFAYGAPDGVMQLWLDRGAAGWRMDVAPWVPDDFWREWRTAVKAHRPDALTVAETWFDASKYLTGDMFDSTMNYIFRNSVLEYAAGGDARALNANLELMREHYPRPAFHALMNLLSTHDSARSLHVLGDHGSDPAATALARERYRLALFLQMTYPGAPAVYYGDEVGLNGGDDPLNRATYPWADLGGKPDLAVLAEFKQLIGLRNQHAVLRRGSIDAPIYLDGEVVVWLRRLGDEVALVAVNNGADARVVEIELPEGSSDAWRDALSGGSVSAAGGKVGLSVPGRFGRVLIGK